MKKTVVLINKEQFVVKLAQTTLEQVRGLMFRKSLPEKSGMIFIFPNQKRRAVWTLFTFISLDILWIDSEGRIAYIEKNTPPHGWLGCKIFNPNKKAQYILELSAGSCSRHNITIGDKVQFLPSVMPG